MEQSFIESWVPLARFEEKYRLSNRGIIWNLGKECEKKQFVVNGYRHVHLNLNGNHVEALMHRLVALHFLVNPYEHPIVNHKDGNKWNNLVTNLEWVSHQENVQHALETGLRTGFMPLQQKRELTARVLSGELIRSLAQEVGRREETLSRMLRVTAERDGFGEDWKNEMKRRRVVVAIRNLESVNA